jgi:hypothetical protein
MPFLSFFLFLKDQNRNIRFMYDESPHFIDTIRNAVQGKKWNPFFGFMKSIFWIYEIHL